MAAEAAEAYLAQTGLKPAPRWTLVIGGDGGGYCYTPADWTQLRDTACRLAAQHGIRWLLTTSRRTPPVAEGSEVFHGLGHRPGVVGPDAGW